MTIRSRSQMIIEKIRTLRICKVFLNGRKLLFIGFFALPITTVGTSMHMHIDNAQFNMQSPVVHTDTVINLDERIHVEFTEQITDIGAYEQATTIMPHEDLVFTWTEDRRSAEIMAKTIWEPDTTYSVAFPSGNYRDTEGLSHIFTFKTAQYPMIIAEKRPHQDKYMKQGEEIILTFDRELDQFDLQLAVRPTLHVDKQVDLSDNTVHMRIVDGSENATEEHRITIFAKYREQDESRYFPIGSIDFMIWSPMPKIWPKAFDERLRVAQKSTTPRIEDGKYIDVNLQGQITTLFEDGRFISNFVNSPGALETPTPKGTFKIYNKDPYALSSMFQVYLPYWMAFTENGEYGFHDLVVWPEGHADMPTGGKESIASIGNAVSPGCVRHDAINSQYIYDWADVGTPVIIY